MNWHEYSYSELGFHTAHIHEYEIWWKINEFHEYEFHIPWICCEYEFESSEYAMNMNLKAMNMPWIWIQNPWMSSYMNQNCMNMNMNTDANSWNMTNIIALAIHESHELYEPKQCFFSRKIDLQL